jgi:hypothetical protein
MGIEEFLSWLLASGGSVMVVSWIVERIPKFQELASDVKEYLFFGLAALISCGAYAVTTYVSATVLAALAPWFMIVSGVFITVIVGKMFHKMDKQ